MTLQVYSNGEGQSVELFARGSGRDRVYVIREAGVPDRVTTDGRAVKRTLRDRGFMAGSLATRLLGLATLGLRRRHPAGAKRELAA